MAPATAPPLAEPMAQALSVAQILNALGSITQLRPLAPLSRSRSLTL
jgi:hypothetical protein